MIAPTVLKTYYNYNVNLPTLYPQGVSTSTSYISNKDTIGWILVYVGVSMGIGLFSGIFISLLLKISERILHKYFDDSDIFRIGAFGLRNK